MTVRVPLAPSVSREDFEDLAHRSGWMLHSVADASDAGPYTETWAIDDGRSAAHYIEDPLLSVAYVLAMGEDERTVSGWIAHEVPTMDEGDAARWALSAVGDADKARSAAYLAATAPPAANRQSLKAFERLLGDPSAEVRRAAAFAASYPAWPELKALIEPLATGDLDERVRAEARETLREYGE